MKVSREALYEKVWEKPLSAVASEYGLTGNGLGKLCDRLNIPRPERNHWTRAPENRDPPPPIGPAPAGVGLTVDVGKGRPTGRRRTRLSLAERQEQLMEIAAQMVIDEGWASVTMKSVARAAGITEAQVHNCFGGRDDLLVALAQREIDAQLMVQRRARRGGTDRLTTVVLSTVQHLHESASRGPLLQILLRSPVVKGALRPEHDRTRTRRLPRVTQYLSNATSLPPSEALAAYEALAAVSRRGGALVSSGRRELAEVEVWCLTIMMAGVRSNDASGKKAA